MFEALQIVLHRLQFSLFGGQLPGQQLGHPLVIVITQITAGVQEQLVISE